VLSHQAVKHLLNFKNRYFSSLKEAENYPQILDQTRVPFDAASGWSGLGRNSRGFALCVESRFFDFALIRFVIFDATKGRLLFAVRFSAAKRTAQVFAMRIGWTGKKKYAAMSAPSQANYLMGHNSTRRSQEQIISKYQSDHRFGPVPLGPMLILKMLRDLD
jgi:hypothetical protein